MDRWIHGQVHGGMDTVGHVGTFYLFTFIFWPHLAVCGILVPWTGTEPVPPAVNVQSPNHWTQREFPPPGHFKGPVDTRLGVLPINDFLCDPGKVPLWSLFCPPQRSHRRSQILKKKERKCRETLCKVLCIYEGLLFLKNIKWAKRQVRGTSLEMLEDFFSSAQSSRSGKGASKGRVEKRLGQESGVLSLLLTSCVFRPVNSSVP